VFVVVLRCSLFVVRVNETGPGGSGRCSDLRATLFGVCRRKRGGVCLSDADEDGDEGGFERRVSGGHSIVQAGPMVFWCFGGGISISRRRVSISVVVVVEMRLCCWSNLAQSVVFPPIPRLTMISAEPSAQGLLRLRQARDFSLLEMCIILTSKIFSSLCSGLHERF